MKEIADPLTKLLTDVILPNLQSVQASQSEQIAANDRLEDAIQELRLHLESQFAHLSAQLMACRAELAATQAALKAAQMQAGVCVPDRVELLN
jgi:prophage antirepressor-like protein